MAKLNNTLITGMLRVTELINGSTLNVQEANIQNTINAAQGNFTTKIISNLIEGTTAKISGLITSKSVNANSLTINSDATVVGSLTAGSVTVDNDTTIKGNLIVNGTTTTIESTSIEIEDKTLLLAKNNTTALTSPAGIVVPKYDGTNYGALAFDSDGIAYVGDVILNTNGNIVGNGWLPIVTRSNLSNNYITKWDNTSKALVNATANTLSDWNDYLHFVKGLNTNNTSSQEVLSNSTPLANNNSTYWNLNRISSIGIPILRSSESPTINETTASFNLKNADQTTEPLSLYDNFILLLGEGISAKSCTTIKVTYNNQTYTLCKPSAGNLSTALSTTFNQPDLTNPIFCKVISSNLICALSNVENKINVSDSAEKLYLTGSTNQTNFNQTYTNSNVYMENGTLHVNKLSVGDSNTDFDEAVKTHTHTITKSFNNGTAINCGTFNTNADGSININIKTSDLIVSSSAENYILVDNNKKLYINNVSGYKIKGYVDYAKTSNGVKQEDTRNTNELPPYYYNKSAGRKFNEDGTVTYVPSSNFVFEFKPKHGIDLIASNAEYWVQMQTYAKWADHTGGSIAQTAVSGNSMFIRNSLAVRDPDTKELIYSWRPWNEFLTTEILERTATEKLTAEELKKSDTLKSGVKILSKARAEELFEPKGNSYDKNTSDSKYYKKYEDVVLSTKPLSGQSTSLVFNTDSKSDGSSSNWRLKSDQTGNLKIQRTTSSDITNLTTSWDEIVSIQPDGIHGTLKGKADSAGYVDHTLRFTSKGQDINSFNGSADAVVDIPSLDGYATQKWTQDWVKGSAKAHDANLLDGKDSTYFASEEKSSDRYDRIISRGENLVINYNGFMKDNTNFEAFVFDGAVANGSSGSFTVLPPMRQGAYDLTNKFPINPNSTYEFTMDFKGNEFPTATYNYVKFFDSDDRQITVSQYKYIPGTLTTLSEDLNNGDTVVHFTSLANWNEKLPNKYEKSFIFWNYVNDSGYAYPPETYSRNYFQDLYTDQNSVNKSNNTITLSQPWNHGTFTKGTYVSQNSSGGTYKYGWIGSPGQDWETHTTIWAGTDYSGTDKGCTFPPGTAKCSIGFLMNYSRKPEAQVWITNVSFREVRPVALSVMNNLNIETDGIKNSYNGSEELNLKLIPESGSSNITGNLEPFETNKHSLGSTSNNWNEVHAKTFVGSLKNNITFQSGKFSGTDSFNNSEAKTINVPTLTSHLTNDSGFVTKDEIGNVYKFRGSVETYADLPTKDLHHGDVWNVKSDGMNYAWIEATEDEKAKGEISRWDSLGRANATDLSGYATQEWVQNTAKAHDADLLDGKDSSYYLSWSNLTEKPDIPDLTGYATQNWVTNEATAFKTKTLASKDGSITSVPSALSLEYHSIVTSGTEGLFPTHNNANSVITMNNHPGNYFSQLGFSANGNVYYRNFDGKALTSENPWKRFILDGEKINATEVNNEPASSVIPQMGIPYGNLGTPTIYEMGFIDQEWTNKFNFFPSNNILIERSTDDNVYTEDTTITDTDKKKLVGGDDSSGIHVPGLSYIRFTFTPYQYVYLNALYLYESTNGSRYTYRIEARDFKTQQWKTIIDMNPAKAIGDWPGHVILRHPRIAFSSTAHSDRVRLTIYSTIKDKNSDIYKLQWWGGYPYRERNIWKTVYDKRISFPNKVYCYGSLDEPNRLITKGEVESSFISKNTKRYWADVEVKDKADTDTEPTFANIIVKNKTKSKIIETGSSADSYFQTKKMRGEGDSATYYHAIDFGHAGHDHVDFYEYGSTWNFWKNTSTAATNNIANHLALSIQETKVQNKNLEFTWPTIDDLTIANDQTDAGKFLTTKSYITENLLPKTDNTVNLGSEDKKWANIYATTFTGNATSANKVNNAISFEAGQFDGKDSFDGSVAKPIHIPTSTKHLTNDSGFVTKDEIGNVYKFKGSVETYDDLPTTDLHHGDVYNVTLPDGMNYAWVEVPAEETTETYKSHWDSLGRANVPDLSGYATQEWVQNTAKAHNADLLDEKDSLYYLNYNNLTNIPVITLNGSKVKSPTFFAPIDENENKTRFNISKKTFPSQAGYYPICTLPHGKGGYSSCLISGRVGGWISNECDYVQCLITNRGEVGFQVINIRGGKNNDLKKTNHTDIEVYVEDNENSDATVYAKCSGFALFSINVTLFQESCQFIWDGECIQNPTGTLSKTLLTTKNSLKLQEGNAYIADDQLATQNWVLAGSDQIEGSLIPKTNNSINLGSSTYKWNNIYATTFNGNLIGDVTGNITGKAGSADKVNNVITFENGKFIESSSSFDGSSSKTIHIPTKLSELTNDSEFITGSYIPLAGSDQITGSLTPKTNNSINLGSEDYQWNNIYGNKFVGSLNTPLTITVGATKYTYNNTSDPNIQITIPDNVNLDGYATQTWVQNTAKAHDADLFDGHDSSYYLKKSGDTMTGDLKRSFRINDKNDIDSESEVLSPSSESFYANPVSKYLWHDLVSFGSNGIPIIQQKVSSTEWRTVKVTDQSTDEEKEFLNKLNKGLFCNKENQSINIIDHSKNILGTSWEWGSGASFHVCKFQWLVIGFAYASPCPRRSIKLEAYRRDSKDNPYEWQTIVNVKSEVTNQAPIWIKINDLSPSTTKLKLTIESVGTEGQVNLAAIKILSSRWGNQGKGSEYEKPYGWDYNGNILPLYSKASSLGSISEKWDHVYATTFDGNATSSNKVNHKLSFSEGQFNNPDPFDGSKPITLNIPTSTSHLVNDSFIPLTGSDQISGSLISNNSSDLGSSKHKWGSVYATTFTGNLTGDVTGNATSANKVNNAISFTAGQFGGDDSFDGSAVKSINIPTSTKHLTNDSNFVTKDEIGNVYKFKGCKSSVDELDKIPIDKRNHGDVYNVTSDGMNYAWVDATKADCETSHWDSLGRTNAPDLSGYATETWVENTLNNDVTAEYKPEGTVSAPKITVTNTTKTVKSVTSVGIAPSFTTEYDEQNQILEFKFNSGSQVTTEDVDVVTGSTATSSEPKFTGTSKNIDIKYVPKDNK